MEILIPYAPHEKQRELHDDKHRYKVIACGRRWGKTVFAVNELIKSAIEVKGQYWYIAPTYKQAKLIAWELLKYYVVPELLKSSKEQELVVHLVNGSTIRLIGADNQENLRGVGLNGVVLDETADIKPHVWQTIIRPMLTDTKGWAIFLGTPKGKQNIFYELYIRDPEKHDKDYRSPYGEPIEEDTDYKSWTFHTVDNPYISADEVDKARKELSPQYFRQEYEASFENYVGIVYKEFSESHCLSGISLKSWYKYFVGIDTGRHTAVSFIAVDDSTPPKAYVFDEIYDFDGIVRDIATRIKAKLEQYKIKPSAIVIDSASQVKREYILYGISVIDSQKDLENSIATIRSLFSQDRLYFDEKCKMHIVEHKGYVWSNKLSGVHNRPTPVKENDHTCNSVQYVINTLHIGRSHDPALDREKETIKYLTESMPEFDFAERG
jgi:hypothetical protein